MIEGKMHPTHWNYAVQHATYILNRSATRTLNGTTPCQALSNLLGDSEEGKEPDVAHFRVFGCRAYVNIPRERRVASEKYKPRGQIGKLVGYKGTHNYLDLY